MKKITETLPPQLEQISSFEFGKLIIQLNIQQLIQLNINKFHFQFLAANSPVYQLKPNTKIFPFVIKTTLWHFYQYLKDMATIKLVLYQNNYSNLTKQQDKLTCIKQIQLISIEKVMSKSYVKGNYIANSVQLCDIFDKNEQNRGYVMFKVKLQFNEQIHKQIKDIVDFNTIINNPQEYNRQQPFVNQQLRYVNEDIRNQYYQIRHDNQSKYDKSLLINSKQVKSINNNQYSNKLPTIQYSEVKHIQEDESKMIQDDIDRLIAQMQNKPYDSSKYLDSQSNANNNTNPNLNNFINNNNQFIHTQPLLNQFIQNSLHSINSLPYDSRVNRFQQQNMYNPNNSHFNPNHSQNRSKSPLNNKKYPPLPVPNHKNPNQSQSFIPNQTIYNQTQRSLSPANSRNRSLNRTQQGPLHTQSMRSISYNQSQMSMTGSIANSVGQSNRGTLKIQIHQLLGRELDVNDCLLRVFVNNQYEDVINCKGFQQGEVIVYNQKAQLNQCLLSDIQKLRFQLQNWEGIVIYSANFQMERLINIPKLEGIFMLNLHPHNQQYYGTNITASQTVLKKLQKPPIQKSLRITVAFTQQLQVIQMYLNLSKFSLNFNKCKYKIPFTKQTVQFQQTQSHFNIFPHSKVYTKLIIQFWDEKAIMGVSQVNLSNLKNITKNILECNLQPIYLYDTVFPIKNIFNQNQVGKYKLLVCCGNVRQIQHVLNKSMLNRSNSMSQMSNSNISTKVPVQVQYDKKLGVFIKDRKVKQQIQIQVDSGQIQKLNNNQKQSQQKKNKNQEYHEISMLSQNQFISEENKCDISLSKVHSIKLSQQQELQDQEDQDQQKVIKNKQKPSPTFNKKKSSKISNQQNNLTRKTSKQTVKQVTNESKVKQQKPKVLKPLQQIICSYIKQAFSPLTQNNLQNYKQLKTRCKPHLLFNFIDIDIIIKQMIDLGINKMYINKLLQILQPLNGMVNFNLLNDYMISIQLEGVVKYNLIPNKLYVKFMLQQYYKLSCQMVYKSIKEEKMNYNRSFNIKSQDQQDRIDYSQWLSNKYLQQISTLDQSIDFNQIRKLFSLLQIKISMNEYNTLKSLLQNQKQINSIIYELCQSKQSYQLIIKNNRNIYEILKLSMIENIINKIKQNQLNSKYQNSILNKLYNSGLYEKGNQSKLYQSKLNQSNMQSNNNSLYQSRASQVQQNNKQYYDKQQFKQTIKNYPIKNSQYQQSIQNKNISSHNNNKSKKSYQQVQDQDDFIINSLNTKNSTKQANHQNKLNVQNIKQQKSYKQDKSYKNQFTQTKKTYNRKSQLQSQQQSNYQNQSIVNLNKYKQSPPQISFSKTGQTVINYQTKRTITVTGLQDCKTTCQCQLDIQLQSPYFKIIIQTPYQKKLYFKQSDNQSQQFTVKGINKQQDQEIEGTISLIDITNKGQLQIALARFIVIKGIQSVYALKTIKQQTFCGLIKIIIE